ncbi:acyl carrier protein [Nocardioides sp.]|uniref:acyl carrier protein n=1 Tax=Nocardioides sp. TaxID=35761 RepID=UPI0035116FDF
MPDERAPAEAGCDQTLQVLILLASQVHEGAVVDESSDLVLLGFDSLDMLTLAEQVAARLHVRCDVEDLFEHASLAGLASLLQSRLDVNATG